MTERTNLSVLDINGSIIAGVSSRLMCERSRSLTLKRMELPWELRSTDLLLDDFTTNFDPSTYR